MLGVELEFEWDEEKAESNLTKASHLLFDRSRDIRERDSGAIDDREDYGEFRCIALGRVDTEIYRVVFTWRGENLIRIVSAQKASNDEREIYYRAAFP